MFRFSIRDVLLLTVVVGLGLAWWLSWRPNPIYGQVSGSISIAGKPLDDGKVFLHSEQGQIIGVKVVKGQFHIHGVPGGRYQVTIEGNGVPLKGPTDKSYGLSVEVMDGTNRFDFDLK